ncbi:MULTISPECIES: MerR family transcriptional regulator [unclassified Gemella]|uniref:MerR family transcriptional regulator n=1 Tax=unclassified Gemella TaxID=2624949 RepID=UPI0015D08CBD|nr:MULTISPECIES: MerR family transcriptional regulator [unclassified Gemella]MBF0710309.1 MerR family transcriptional regulator [Gemella sp. GL1.1]NYS27653.1 MerR family transcriptional regulator [Gemella sp. GL1]
MKKINIKYAADILNLNSSTLRYWEKEGLINFSRGESNNYREFSSNDLLELLDLQLCRDLEIPLKELKGRKQWNLEKWEEVSDTQLKYVEEKIKKYRILKNKILRKKFLIEEIERNKDSLIYVEALDIAYKFLLEDDSIFDKTIIIAYRENPEVHGIFISLDTSKMSYGIFSNSSEEKFIWQNKKAEGFLFGILKVGRDGTLSNLNELLNLAQLEGCEIDYIVGKYLISANDGEEFCDYYGAYLKIR